MILLRLITWPYVRKHLLRSALTTAGVLLGVAVFVGMHTANRSVLAALSRTVDRIAGATELQVTAGETGFPEAVLEQVQAVPEVRVAVPVIEAVVDSGLAGQGNLLILAVDMTGDRSLRDYDLESGDQAVVDDPLVFLAQPDSIIITNEFARKNGLGSGSRLTLKTMDGEKRFTVRGVMRSGGLGRAFGGSLAVMDVYAAQMVFGRGRSFDRIDLALREGVTLDQGRRAVERVVGPGLQVAPPATRGRQYESVLRVYAIVMGLTSSFALFIGMFIIYNSFAIAVTQRRAEIGILRALGATRQQIRNLFVGESAIAGLLGSVAGLFFGLLMARGMAGYIGSFLEGLYGVGERPDEIQPDPRVLALALAMGIVTSVVAGVLPAQAASRVDPIKALQKGKNQVLSAGESRIRSIAAGASAVLAAALTWFGSGEVAFYAGYFLAIAAALLMTPMLALLLSRLIRPALKWLRPVEGALAADSLIQAPRRTSATVAALMLSLTLVVGLGGISRGSREAIMGWVDSALNPDLFVAPTQALTNRQFRFPLEMEHELAAIDGIAEVQGVRSSRTVFRGTPTLLVALSVDGWAKWARRAPVEGDEETMYREAAAGRGFMVADNLAALAGLHVGDQIELPAPNGTVRLPVVGVVADWSDQTGALFLDRSVYLRHWGDRTANVFRVYLKKGAGVERVKEAILARYEKKTRIFVLTNGEVRRFIGDLTDQWMGITYAQLGVAVLVAILGIVNTLTVSIIDRRRELGVLRAVGALRSQIRHTIWMEAAAIVLVGLVLGLALGALNLTYVLETAHRDISGMTIPFRYPYALTFALVPVMLLAAFVSALWPSEAAVRGSLVQALEYE